MIIINQSLEEMQREIADRMTHEHNPDFVAESQAELLMEWILERYEIRPIQKGNDA